MATSALCATQDFADFYHVSPPLLLYQVEEPTPTQTLLLAP